MKTSHVSALYKDLDGIFNLRWLCNVTNGGNLTLCFVCFNQFHLIAIKMIVHVILYVLYSDRRFSRFRTSEEHEESCGIGGAMDGYRYRIQKCSQSFLKVFGSEIANDSQTFCLHLSCVLVSCRSAFCLALLPLNKVTSRTKRTDVRFLKY